MAVFPRYCAEQKVQTSSAAAGGHRRVATRETTGDLATRRGAGDPERRAEWTTVLRFGHLRSAPVVVDVALLSEWEPPTLRASLCELHAPSWGASSVASCLSSDASVLADTKNTCGREHLDGAPRQKPKRRLTHRGFSHCATVKKGTAGRYSICSGGQSCAPNHTQSPSWFRAARYACTVWARATTLSKIPFRSSPTGCLPHYATVFYWVGRTVPTRQVCHVQERVSNFPRDVLRKPDFEVSSLRPFSVPPVYSVSSRSRWNTPGLK